MHASPPPFQHSIHRVTSLALVPPPAHPFYSLLDILYSNNKSKELDGIFRIKNFLLDPIPFSFFFFVFYFYFILCKLFFDVNILTLLSHRYISVFLYKLVNSYIFLPFYSCSEYFVSFSCFSSY